MATTCVACGRALPWWPIAVCCVVRVVRMALARAAVRVARTRLVRGYRPAMAAVQARTSASDAAADGAEVTAYRVAYVTAPVAEAPQLAAKIVDSRLGTARRVLCGCAARWGLLMTSH